MSRNFLLALIGGLLFLAVFAFFIFSMNPSMTTETKGASSSNTTKQSSAEKLIVEDITIGTGSAVKSGDTVVIHYRGTLKDGSQFDSSYDRGEPYETQIGVGSVIEGWDKGVPGMKVGGKRKLTIPAELAYGEQGSGSIPPNSTLIFEVELLEIK